MIDPFEQRVLFSGGPSSAADPRVHPRQRDGSEKTSRGRAFPPGSSPTGPHGRGPPKGSHFDRVRAGEGRPSAETFDYEKGVEVTVPEKPFAPVATSESPRRPGPPVV